MHLHDGVEVLRRHREHHAVAQDAGVVHQHVELAEVLDRGVDDVLRAVEVGDAVVVRDGFAAPLDDDVDDVVGGALVAFAFAAHRSAEVVDDDLGTVIGEHDRFAAADAVARSGDDRHLAVEHAHLRGPPRCEKTDVGVTLPRPRDPLPIPGGIGAPRGALERTEQRHGPAAGQGRDHHRRGPGDRPRVRGSASSKKARRSSSPRSTTSARSTRCSARRQWWITSFATDISDPDSAQRCVDETVSTFGTVDILVNNAALYYDIDNFDPSYEYLQKVTAVNQHGTWLMTRAAAPVMVEHQYGRVINQSSGAAYMYGMPEMPFSGLGNYSYSMTKWGIVGLTKFMARQLGQ